MFFTTSMIGICFLRMPLVAINQIRREAVLRICLRIINYAKALLDEGFYVYAAGNTAHIPAYHNEHYWAHKMFVYIGMVSTQVETPKTGPKNEKVLALT